MESRIAEALEGDQTDTEPNAVINVGREKPRGKGVKGNGIRG